MKVVSFSDEQAEKNTAERMAKVRMRFFIDGLFAAKIVFNKKNTLSLRQIKNKASLEIKIENK